MRTNSTSKRTRGTAPGGAPLAESGFTMLEMVVAMVVLMAGLLVLAQAVGYALTVSNRGRNVTNTKLLIASVLEQMENLRNTKELTFGQIANVNSPLLDGTGKTRDFDGFLNDFQPVSSVPGPDGIYGTGDDLADPGPDGKFGTKDDKTDQTLAHAGYFRKIVITQVSNNPNLRRIEVTIKYPGGDKAVRTISGVSYLNNDARSNFLR